MNSVQQFVLLESVLLLSISLIFCGVDGQTISLKTLSDIQDSIDEFSIFQHVANQSPSHYQCRGRNLKNVDAISQAIDSCKRHDHCDLLCAVCVLTDLGLVSNHHRRKRAEDDSNSILDESAIKKFLTDTIPDDLVGDFQKGVNMCTRKYQPQKGEKGCLKFIKLVHCVAAVSVQICDINFDGDKDSTDVVDQKEECRKFGRWFRRRL